MAEPDTRTSLLSVLPLHFDVPQHHVPLEFFVRTARDVAAVIDAINDRIFQGQLGYEVVILPTEEGSFLGRIGLLAKIGGVIFVGLPLAIENDIAKGFIEGLTRKTTHEWSKQIGTAISDAIQSQFHSEDDEEARIIEDDRGPLQLVKECTTSFLEARPDELARLGISPKDFRSGFHARNDFYANCLSLTDLAAVGFDTRGSFPVERADFQEFIVRVPEDDDDQIPTWSVSIELLRVTSPNWDDGDKQRLWKAQDESGRDRYFRIEDDEFWFLAKRNLLKPALVNEMKVQWAFRHVNGRSKDHRVLRVLEFNNKKLARPIDERELEAVVGKLLPTVDNNIQYVLNFEGDP